MTTEHGTDESEGRQRERVDDWDSHWDAFGEAAAKNPANLYRLRLVLRQLENEPSTTRVLDIGSGQGELTLAIAARHPEFLLKGLEYSASGVERARVAASRRGIRAQFEQRDLLLGNAGPDETGWADAAVCSEVLEHLDDPAEFLKNALTYVRPGGRLIVTVPAGPRSALDRHIGHRRHFDRRSLRDMLTGAGLQNVTISRAGFPFFDLYRLAVVARGRSLISDIDSGSEGQSAQRRQNVIRLVSRLFEKMFALNLDDSPLGWQLVATAVVPAPD